MLLLILHLIFILFYKKRSYIIFKFISNLILNYCRYGPNYWSQTASLQPICMAHRMLSVPLVLICSSSLIFGRIGHIELNVVEIFRVQNSGSTFSKWKKYDHSFITSLYYALAVLGFSFRRHSLFQLITHILSHLSIGQVHISSNSTSKNLTMTFKIDQALIKLISNPLLSNVRRSPLSPT